MGQEVIGTVYGHWRIVQVRGRAVTAICKCGTTKVLSLDAIESGDAPPSCGCAPLSRVERGKLSAARRRRNAALETRTMLKDWKPRS